MSVNYLKLFNEGEKIKAVETNQNNQFLLDTINTKIEKIDTYVKRLNNLPILTPMTFDCLLSDKYVSDWVLQGSLVTMLYPDAVNMVTEAYNDELAEAAAYYDIPCKRAVNGWYIADISKKADIDAIYEERSVADIYILDAENKQFYLPRKTKLSAQRYLVKTKKATAVDPSWYNVYSDGWTEQGGEYTGSTGSAKKTITFEIPFNNASYSIYSSLDTYSEANIGASEHANTRTTTGFTVRVASDRVYCWKAEGYGAIPESELIPVNEYLYYKVGNTIVNEDKIDVQELTGAVNNLQSGKADINLSNTLKNVSQAFKNEAVSWGMPDYSKIVNLTNNTDFTCPCAGIWHFEYSSQVGQPSYYYINNIRYNLGYSANYATHSDFTLLVSKDDVIKAQISLSLAFAFFAPMKGVN